MPKANKQGKRKSPKKSGGGMQLVRHLPCSSSFPSTMKVLMTYSQQNNITEAAASTGITYFYRLNSVFDPDFTGAGTTANGYTTFSPLFYTYRVRRATVRLLGTCTCSTSGFVDVVIAPLPVSVITSNPLSWRSIPGSDRVAIAPTTNGGKNMVDLTRTYDMAKVMRLTKQQFDSDMDFAADISTNPVRPVFFLVSACSVGSGTVGAFSYTLDITYEVEWSRPIPLTP